MLLHENRNFEYKEDKAAMQILNLNTKTIKSKHFIYNLERFPQTVSFCFKMPTSEHKYQCFLILVQSFRACTFSEKRCLSPQVQTFTSLVIHLIFLLNGLDKKAKQNSSKTKQHSQQQEAKSVRRRTTVSQRDFFWRVVTETLRWLASLHLPIVFSSIWLTHTNCPIFLKLDSLPICKGKPYVKQFKLIFNWTVRKN